LRPFPCTGKLSSCEAGHERPATARKAPPTQGAPRYRHPPARPNEDLSSSHAPGPPGRSSRGRHRAGADDTTQDRPPLRASRSRSRKAAAARARDARLEELKAESAHRARSPVTPSAVWADGRHSLYRVSSGAVIGNIEVSEVVKVRALGSDRGSSRGALSVPRGALAEMMPGVRVRPPCRRRRPRSWMVCCGRLAVVSVSGSIAVFRPGARDRHAGGPLRVSAVDVSEYAPEPPGTGSNTNHPSRDAQDHREYITRVGSLRHRCRGALPSTATACPSHRGRATGSATSCGRMLRSPPSRGTRWVRCGPEVPQSIPRARPRPGTGPPTASRGLRAREGDITSRLGERRARHFSPSPAGAHNPPSAGVWWRVPHS